MTIPTYEELLEQCLARVADDIDKREGSLIYTALAPACAELAQAYIELSGALDLAFVDTSAAEYLDRLVAQFGMSRDAATYAVRRGEFTGQSGASFAVPSGMRFCIDGLFFVVGDKIEDGAYKMTCETAGTDGNTMFGEILPVDYLSNFGTATLTDVLIPGEDEETGLVLRVSQVENRILNVSGVLDISGTAINGAAQNLVLDADSVPFVTGVTLNE